MSTKNSLSLSTTELAYIAGLFDGEGYVGITYPKQSGKRYTRLQATITNTDHNVLLWLRRKIGTGSIHVAHKAGPTRKRCYRLSVARRSARTFLRDLLPYLRIKRPDVCSALRIDRQTVRPRRIRK